MSRLPAYLLRHELVHEPYLGSGAHGPTFGPPVTLPCFADRTHRGVLGADGAQVTATATYWLQLDAAEFSPEDRVTERGRTARVVAVSRRDGGGLPTPDHLEVHVQ